MTSSSSLSVSQLAQRHDEITGLIEMLKANPGGGIYPIMERRTNELQKQIEAKTAKNFNQGVVTPLPPDHIDVDSSVVITPKAPSQVDREYNEWEKSLDG